MNRKLLELRLPRFRYLILHAINSTRRYIWNRNIKLFWNKLWIRGNEFHSSLNMDVRAMWDMNIKQREKYMQDLARRRNIAHQRDLS